MADDFEEFNRIVGTDTDDPFNTTEEAWHHYSSRLLERGANCSFCHKYLVDYNARMEYCPVRTEYKADIVSRFISQGEPGIRKLAHAMWLAIESFVKWKAGNRLPDSYHAVIEAALHKGIEQRQLRIYSEMVRLKDRLAKEFLAEGEIK